MYWREQLLQDAINATVQSYLDNPDADVADLESELDWIIFGIEPTESADRPMFLPVQLDSSQL